MAFSWRGSRPGYDAYGQPASASTMHPSLPQPPFDWNGMPTGGLMGEDGYGSFASMDADLLHLQDMAKFRADDGDEEWVEEGALTVDPENAQGRCSAWLTRSVDVAMPSGSQQCSSLTYHPRTDVRALPCLVLCQMRSAYFRCTGRTDKMVASVATKNGRRTGHMARSKSAK